MSKNELPESQENAVVAIMMSNNELLESRERAIRAMAANLMLKTNC